MSVRGSVEMKEANMARKVTDNKQHIMVGASCKRLLKKKEVVESFKC